MKPSAEVVREQLSLPGFGSPPPEKRNLTSARQPGVARPTLRLFLALFPHREDAALIAERMDKLRQLHGLRGQRLQSDRLHITLHSLGDYVEALPPALVDTTIAAASNVVHPPLDIVFDRALSFTRGNVGKHPFVLCGRDTSAVSQFGKILGISLKQAGLRAQASGKPHMTMLYDGSVIEEQAVEPIRWTATEFVLVLSHLGETRHEWLARWPLPEAC